MVTPKQEMERKSEWFCGVKFFRSNFKLSQKTVFEEKFAFSLVVFCSHAAISLGILLCFSIFGPIFFLNGFPNSFIVRSRPSFCLNQNLNSR